MFLFTVVPKLKVAHPGSHLAIEMVSPLSIRSSQLGSRAPPFSLRTLNRCHTITLQLCAGNRAMTSLTRTVRVVGSFQREGRERPYCALLIELCWTPPSRLSLAQMSFECSYNVWVCGGCGGFAFSCASCLLRCNTWPRLHRIGRSWIVV